jgi:hypothetical protein
MKLKILKNEIEKHPNKSYYKLTVYFMESDTDGNQEKP